MIAAGQEERQLAIKRGNYDEDALATSIDGGWGKRSASFGSEK
jgi:hypothetical protein